MTAEQVAIVAGAGQGIGYAIARRLAAAGTEVWMVARRAHVLEEAAESIGALARPFPADLTDADARADLVDAFRSEYGSLDVLVNSAGMTHLGTMDNATESEFEEQLSANVVAPYALTRACLPLLRAARGQVVFVNSSAGKSANPGVGQYSATQHAVRAFADSLRAEVNQDGVRVTVVHPGRTASPRQEAIHAYEGKTYCPERLMQPDDVAEVVYSALTIPRTAEVTEISLRPMQKP